MGVTSSNGETPRRGLGRVDHAADEGPQVSVERDPLKHREPYPSGNVWLPNNRKKTGPYQPVYQTNPGGNSFVIIPGAAGPVKTPLIRPPNSF